MDEPTADGCAIAVYFLSRLASKDVKVVLSGEGADEFFGIHVVVDIRNSFHIFFFRYFFTNILYF